MASVTCGFAFTDGMIASLVRTVLAGWWLHHRTLPMRLSLPLKISLYFSLSLRAHAHTCECTLPVPRSPLLAPFHLLLLEPLPSTRTYRWHVERDARVTAQKLLLEVLDENPRHVTAKVNLALVISHTHILGAARRLRSYSAFATRSCPPLPSLSLPLDIVSKASDASGADSPRDAVSALSAIGGRGTISSDPREGDGQRGRVAPTICYTIMDAERLLEEGIHELQLTDQERDPSNRDLRYPRIDLNLVS